ncbi:hypothetical protein THITH_13860 [Thioalkalivibrio paradoxus ARh 1]|uniref:Uncharacterized protein n=1 Tax=Thioalkalivibrio paradoxus ARh 1 TaxID=713585 RepID=W0DTR2_9GAMM|nr:hypothetical protein THITH_13860 [Thioalkalivibrio paradoxus ARh 1]
MFVQLQVRHMPLCMTNCRRIRVREHHLIERLEW